MKGPGCRRTGLPERAPGSEQKSPAQRGAFATAVSFRRAYLALVETAEIRPWTAEAWEAVKPGMRPSFCNDAKAPE